MGENCKDIKNDVKNSWYRLVQKKYMDSFYNIYRKLKYQFGATKYGRFWSIQSDSGQRTATDAVVHSSDAVVNLGMPWYS